MEIRDALRATASVRTFVAKSVDDMVVRDILDDARFAPSGGNRQPWRVALVKNPVIRRRLADEMKPVWNAYVSLAQTGRTPFAVVDGAPALTTRPVDVPFALIDDIESVPVVLAVAADLSRIATMDAELPRPALSGGGSIYPFCWSILLAARSRGLGGVMTTFATRAEPTTGPLLGLPKGHALAATLFLGPVDNHVTKLRRNPVDSFATIDRFDGPPLPSGT
ncbi:MAG: nitroreductase family protein [Ilumatobacteraceae bacterium]|nr:nitroreductase family protein [Ilumatobacteraceae bacterium]